MWCILYLNWENYLIAYLHCILRLCKRSVLRRGVGQSGPFRDTA